MGPKFRGSQLYGFDLDHDAKTRLGLAFAALEKKIKTDSPVKFIFQKKKIIKIFSFGAIMENFMQPEFDSVWVTGDDEPHPLKHENYQNLYYYYADQRRQNELKDDQSSETQGKIAFP